LRKDDVVLEFRGIRIEDDNHLVNLVGLTEVDKEVPIVVFRDRRKVTVMVKVGDWRKFDQKRSEATPARGDTPVDLGSNQVEVWDIDELGVSVVPIDPASAAKLNLQANTRGLMVTEVSPLGPAVGQISSGEIIDAIDQRLMRGIGDLDAALLAASPSRPLQLRLLPRDSSGPAARVVLITPKLKSTR
jgi:serine protease Do